jgi:hypothetical protein
MPGRLNFMRWNLLHVTILVSRTFMFIFGNVRAVDIYWKYCSPLYFMCKCQFKTKRIDPKHSVLVFIYLWHTYSMEQSSSWEANRFVGSQEIPRILLNPKVHYRIHNCPSPVHILSQLDPIHTPTSHILDIHLNIIFQSKPGYPKWPLSLRFLHLNPVYASPLPYTLYMPRRSHSSIFYHPKNSGWAVQIRLLVM